MYAPVAQLDRVPGFGPGGWGFEPSRAYFLKPSLFYQAWLFYDAIVRALSCYIHSNSLSFLRSFL